MARKIDGNLSTRRVLLGGRDVGISRDVPDAIAVHHDRLLDGQRNADSSALFCHMAANHTTTVSCSGNERVVSKWYLDVG